MGVELGTDLRLVGTLGYGSVAILYGAITALLVTSWRGGRIGGWVIAALVVSVAWSTILAIQTTTNAVPLGLLFLLETLRFGFWILFLGVIVAKIGISRVVWMGGQVAWIAVLAAGLLIAYADQAMSVELNIGMVMIPGGLIVALIGLVLIEQLYRNTALEGRWRVNPLVIGLGGAFAYDLFLYAQGLLFGAIDVLAWNARGAVNALFVPFIAMAARRNPNWDLDIFVSRHVVFYTGSLLAVGAYLILVSLGGYAILIYGGRWGPIAETIFVVGAILVLVALLFSSAIRARARVFLSKHFFRNKYDYRQEWLRLVSTLSAVEQDSTRNNAIRAMAQMVGSPGGLLWLLDDKTRIYTFASSYNAESDAPDIAEDDPIVTFIKRDYWLVDFQEMKITPDLYKGLSAPAWLRSIPRAWLMVPVTTQKRLIGLLLLFEAPGVPRLNYEDRDLLKTVGQHIAVHLAQEKSDTLLAESQQFEAYNRLTAFLMHDLNNLIAQQSLILKNAEKHRSNPQFIDDALKTIANSVSRMNGVMNQLRRRDQGVLSRRVDLKFLISAAIDRCMDRNPKPTYGTPIPEISVNVDFERFVSILVHLIRNAQDATGSDGIVEVRATVADSVLSVTVRDTGCGMTPEFCRVRLFRPFDSTKGSQGMGIGVYQVREFARSLGGDLRVESRVGIGTLMIMTVPVK
ncbi:MAG: PEP-CTERM system histidine kinase PrsK [Gammaproteobacteria bacterium]|nr:PEP-CTERM system histidine kinase PrsK [Gammaproteobacteria bacterium]MDH5239232.1 PEP-CTERM system histidine kinase PrsK [Gammaproteobacteria bacterium]MDH5259903.1 PEP-CTERM system histidine kinase PrsK [Gammaproteobacteria bacterium]